MYIIVLLSAKLCIGRQCRKKKKSIPKRLLWRSNETKQQTNQPTEIFESCKTKQSGKSYNINAWLKKHANLTYWSSMRFSIQWTRFQALNFDKWTQTPSIKMCWRKKSRFRFVWKNIIQQIGQEWSEDKAEARLWIFLPMMYLHNRNKTLLNFPIILTLGEMCFCET